MAIKALKAKIKEAKLLDLKMVASVFQITVTEAINVAVDSYLAKMKQDPFIAFMQKSKMYLQRNRQKFWIN